MRIFFSYSEAEWRLIEKAAKKAGFKDPLRYIHSQLHKGAKVLPLPPRKLSKKIRKTLSINDKKLIKKLEAYSDKNSLTIRCLASRISADRIISGCA